MSMEVTGTAEGNTKITATHESTFEFTQEPYMTAAGDCILGISCDIVPADFSADFRTACQHESSIIKAILTTPNYREIIKGRGHPDLKLTTSTSMVGRTSSYIDDRTIMINADKAAQDLDRDFVAELQNGCTITVTLSVEQ
ncbi:MAG: DUF371 domain-containing protein [Halobacteriaceae archaeon]